MKYAFSPSGLALLKKFGGENALLAFDYDGTLAPIVKRPRRAGIPPATESLLEELSRVAPTAAVTGRSLKDIRGRVPKTFRALAGNHGAEIAPFVPGHSPSTLPTRRRIKAWAQQLRDELMGIPGVIIEEKALSLCVHYRASPNKPATRRLVFSAVARLHPGPRALSGKCIVNLLAPELPHKGNAVQTLLKKLDLRTAVYVGDDENDEDVFALADPRVCSVRVGKRAGSRASLYLRRQSEINRLLRFLLSLRKPENSQDKTR